MLKNYSDKAIEIAIENQRIKRIFYRELLVILNNSSIRTVPGSTGEVKFFRASPLADQREVGIGALMEDVATELKMVNEECEESKKVIQNIYNEVVVLHESVKPKLIEQIRTVREYRMTTVSEISQMLTIMRDIRKFFLESDYQEEIKRLKEFVGLCKEIKKLKEDGTFDAICDSALKLSVREGE